MALYATRPPAPASSLDDILGQRLRANWARQGLALSRGRPALAHPLAHLLGIEAHQLHEGFIAEKQTRQGMHALNAVQGLQALERDIWHDGNHLSLDRRAMDARQQRHPPTSSRK
jgi:hypothetical protein